MDRLKIPESPTWIKRIHEFSTILGESRFEAEVLDYDGPTILKPGEDQRLRELQAVRYFALLGVGAMRPDPEELLYLQLIYRKRNTSCEERT